LIKDELDAGRPVIMGFNAGQAFDGFIPVSNGGTMETVYIGKPSNGTPAAGTIDHYAVITGYRRLGGLDVLTMNLGWQDDTTDVNLKWTPAGKWPHPMTARTVAPTSTTGRPSSIGRIRSREPATPAASPTGRPPPSPVTRAPISVPPFAWRLHVVARLP